MSELRDNVKQWHRSRQMDITELSNRMRASSLAAAASATTSPIRPKASVAAGSTPKRTTRSQAREAEEVEKQMQTPSAPPQWGAWQGGDIRFND